MFIQIYLGPDSKDSYNVLKSVMRNIDFAAKKIKFTFQMVPLPYHFYAFKIHQGKTNKIQPFTLFNKTLVLMLPSNLLTISLIAKISLQNKF